MKCGIWVKVRRKQSGREIREEKKRRKHLPSPTTPKSLYGYTTELQEYPKKHKHINNKKYHMLTLPLKLKRRDQTYLA